MLKNIAFFITVLVSLPTLAGGSYVGKLRPFTVSGSLYLIPYESVKTQADCATRAYLRLPDAPGTAEFNMKFSIILAAWMAKQELKVTGTGGCTSEGDEVISQILMQ